MLITLNDAGAVLVIIGRTEEMVVVSSGVIERRERIVLHFRNGSSRQFYAQFIKIFAVGRESEFIGIRKPVKSDVLHRTRVLGILKGISQRILSAHTPPYRLRNETGISVDGNAVLIAFHSVLKYVFGNVSEIEIQVPSFSVGVVGVKERVEKPELQILHV